MGPTVTRLPYPLDSELRHQAVNLGYRILGAALGTAFRRKIRIAELETARILILKPCCLGDVVFSTALVRELRRSLPRAHLTYAVGKHSRPALQGAPVDAIFDTEGIDGGKLRLGDYLHLVWRIRAGRYDACFVLERSALLALLPALAGIPLRIGIDSGGRGFSLGVGVAPRPIRPEAELYLDLLRAVGGRVERGDLEYHPAGAAEARIDRLLAELRLDGPFVLLHAAGGVNPGMALTRKRWPAERFAELAQRIIQAGAAAVFVGGPGDAPHPLPPAPRGGEGSLAEYRARARPRWSQDDPHQARCSDLFPSPLVGEGGGGEGERPPIIDLVGQLSLDELATLARRAAAYVGNDSGPTHLAEAAGARVVMLFGPSDPLMYGPRSRAATAVSAGMWCSPCFEDGRVAPCANVLCMPAIPIERVWREVAEGIAAYREGR